MLKYEEIEELYKEMSKEIFISEVLERTEPIQGAISSIKRISQEFDIYIITARTEKMIKQVKQWLEKHNISKNIKEVISSSYENKQDICLEKGIDFLCDDDIRHVIDKKIKIRVLFNKKGSVGNENIIVTESWPEVEKILFNE